MNSIKVPQTGPVTHMIVTKIKPQSQKSKLKMKWNEPKSKIRLMIYKEKRVIFIVLIDWELRF